MTVKRCTLCSCLLTPNNNTEEHIIPNAIGGRKRVQGFVCRSCNSDSGAQWDDELAKQLNPFSIHLGIKRQRGHVPPQAFPTASGQSIRVNADGTMTPAKPEITVTTEEGKTQIHVVARSGRELRQTLEGLQRKYPQLQDADIDRLILETQGESHYSSDLIKISPEFGGNKAGRSLVKSAVALVFDAGVDPSQCDLALDYLLHEGKEPCFGYYYVPDKDIIVNRPPHCTFHCVYVEGSADSSTLFGYIELFSLWRIVLCLSQTYTGTDFSHKYAIDPVKGEELNLSFNFNLSSSDIQQAYEYRRYDEQTFMAALSKVFDQIQDTGFNRALDQAINSGIKEAMVIAGVTEESDLTEAEVRDFTKILAARILPFITHHITPMNLPVDLIPDEYEENVPKGTT